MTNYLRIYVFSITACVVLYSAIATSLSAQTPLIELPTSLPATSETDEKLNITLNGESLDLTINPYIQARLDKYMNWRGNPVAAVVLADVKTGKILAMSQGKKPQDWGASLHTALHPYFPAASLFKTVVASAALEITDVQAEQAIGLIGGCSNVNPTGTWLVDQIKDSRRQMTLRRAYGNSCNSFFAKLAINNVGLSAINNYANKFGWGNTVTTDFKLEPSPFNPPSVKGSSIHSIGRYAAGFGSVGMSVVQAAWQMLAIANDGVSKPIYIFDKNSSIQNTPPTRIISQEVSQILRDEIMDATILGGTASFAFSRGKHRALRHRVGGKTGTLSGKFPEGITTWFAGMMPLDNPEVVVSAVVVLEDLWHIKAPNLAAEALLIYEESKKTVNSVSVKKVLEGKI